MSSDAAKGSFNFEHDFEFASVGIDLEVAKFPIRGMAFDRWMLENGFGDRSTPNFRGRVVNALLEARRQDRVTKTEAQRHFTKLVRTSDTCKAVSELIENVIHIDRDRFHITDSFDPNTPFVELDFYSNNRRQALQGSNRLRGFLTKFGIPFLGNDHICQIQLSPQAAMDALALAACGIRFEDTGAISTKIKKPQRRV